MVTWENQMNGTAWTLLFNLDSIIVHVLRNWMCPASNISKLLYIFYFILAFCWLAYLHSRGLILPISLFLGQWHAHYHLWVHSFCRTLIMDLVKQWVFHFLCQKEWRSLQVWQIYSRKFIKMLAVDFHLMET